MNISESQTLLLADHMGHDILIHKKHYKLNKEILQLSKLLEKASGNEEDNESNDTDEEDETEAEHAPAIEQDVIESRNSDLESEFGNEIEVQSLMPSSKKRSSKYINILSVWL